MPARSKAQFRFMHAVAAGSVKVPGLSRQEAREFVAGQSPKNLPERAPRRDARQTRPARPARPTRGAKPARGGS